jgi:hypothetical protein
MRVLAVGRPPVVVTHSEGGGQITSIGSYDNQGLKLLQLRFYQVPSDVPTSISC